KCRSDMNGRTCQKGRTKANNCVSRAPFYAILKRIEASKDFFDRAWKLQARCMALFGPGIEETFLLLQTARREIEVSAAMLLQDPEPKSKTEHNLEFWNSMRMYGLPMGSWRRKGIRLERSC